jgi:5'-methylthioinosine phosphorylase
MIGLVLGTAMYEPLAAGAWPSHPVDTPYGTAQVCFPAVERTTVPVVLRHGLAFTVLPGQVNYRANLWALRALGVRDVLATNACGAIDAAFEVGDLAMLADFLDLTHGRATELADDPVPYREMQDAYDADLRELVCRCADEVGVRVHRQARYACANGPRFESVAEIEMIARGGAQLVGMTGASEAVVARRLGLRYASIAVTSNPAAGRGAPVESTQVDAAVRAVRGQVYQILRRTVASYRTAPAVEDLSGPGLAAALVAEPGPS